jgi:hypothetical protein
VQKSSALSLSENYGVLTRKRLTLWIGALVLLSASIATLLGFIGARDGISFSHFDWSLAAVAGTAIGTIVLAGFTGALAWTTSGDVRATIRLADATVEDQRARNRPIVAVRVVGVSWVVLDGTSRESVAALQLWLKNVGLGPALDLRLRASYEGTIAPTEEVIAVVAVDEEIVDRPISLARLSEPQAGFDPSKFEVSGECTDRTRTERHPIVVLTEAGLPDQLRAAQQAAAKKAWLQLTPGPHEASERQGGSLPIAGPEQRASRGDRRSAATGRRLRHRPQPAGDRGNDARSESSPGNRHLPIPSRAFLLSPDLARRAWNAERLDRGRLPDP